MNKEEYYKLLRLGALKRSLRERIERNSREPSLRGGNSSAMFGNRVIGAIPKEVVLRYLGLEMPPSLDTYLMFDGGYANEDLHSEMLKEAGAQFKCEDEIPISHSVTVLDENEEPVEFPITGRPDRGMLFKEEVSTIIEEKRAASSWSVKRMSHWGLRQPKDEAICQNAHYMWQHNYANGILCITSREWHSMKAKLNTLAIPDHRAILPAGDDWSFGVMPFITLYDLEWKDDLLYFEGKKTVVTTDRIREFYEYIAHCLVMKEIPEVHFSDIFGAPKTKSKVTQYYEHKDCDESSWEVWTAAVKAKCDAAWAEVEQEAKELEVELRAYTGGEMEG